MPVMLGVLTGSLCGGAYPHGRKHRVLRLVFAIVVGLMAVEMIVNGLHGKI